MTLEEKLITKIQWAWEQGSPITGSEPDGWKEIAAFARRRWRSFDRRINNKEKIRVNRIEDLAKGLCENFESGGLKMAGPLISDYQWLAEQLSNILEIQSE